MSRRYKMRVNKDKRGITLIALVVTIVVLLILARC
ncbi:MAG: prepilin-type N-terminal cleavage/methylation domain-containing protein [Clostridia bacterium]